MRGNELATPSLVAAMERKGRTIVVVELNSEEERYLDLRSANANAGGIQLKHILVRADVRLIEIWEEFLHGTQKKCGLILDTQALTTAEIHVKRFMIRHRRLIGISDEDAVVLECMAEFYEVFE